MTITSRVFGRIMAVLVFIAFITLYWQTLYKGICPGESAHSVAVALNLESGASQMQVHRIETQVPDRMVGGRLPTNPQVLTVRTVEAQFQAKHLLWRTIAANVAKLPFGTLDMRLNGMSAIFGALAIMLAFALGRGVILFLNFHDSPVSSRNRKISAMASGLVATATLGLSSPFWLAATRCSPATFEAFLLLLMGWLLFSAAVYQGNLALLCFGVVWGLTLFESEIGIYIAALMALFAIRAMLVGGLMNVRGWCNCLVGIIIGQIAYLLLTQFSLPANEASMVLPFKELMASIKVAASLIFAGGIFEDQARLVSIFFAVLPFITATALAIWYNPERSAAATGFLTFLLICTTFIAITATPISPWGAYKINYPDTLPVLVFVITAATATYLASAGAIMASGKILNLGGRRSEDDEEEASEAPVGRLIFWVVFILAIAIGLFNWREVRDSQDTFISHTASEFVKRLGNNVWLTSTTPALDTMIRIKAQQDGKKVNVIDRNYNGSDQVKMSRLRRSIYRDPIFNGLPLDTLSDSLYSTNINEFVMTWIKTDNDIGGKLLLDAPDLWIATGNTPVPEIIGYRKMAQGEKINWDELTKRHISFWNAVEQGASILGPAAPKHLRTYRSELRAYLCDIGQNLAESLVQADKAAKAREVLDKISDLRHEVGQEELNEKFY